jgi:hypothetical protein
MINLWFSVVIELRSSKHELQLSLISSKNISKRNKHRKLVKLAMKNWKAGRDI